MAVLLADGLDRRRALFDRAQPSGRIYVQLSGEPRHGAARSARARADRLAGAAAYMGEPAHVRAGARGRRIVPQAQAVRVLPGDRRACRALTRRWQEGADPAQAAACGRRVRRLRAGARSPGAAPRALGLYGWRAARARRVPLLP